jgi:hypothetical protein
VGPAQVQTLACPEAMWESERGSVYGHRVACRREYLGREAVLDARISQTGLLFSDTVRCAPPPPSPCVYRS